MTMNCHMTQKSHSGYIFGEIHNIKRYMYPDIHYNTIYNNQYMEDMIHIYTTKYYSAIQIMK